MPLFEETRRNYEKNEAMYLSMFILPILNVLKFIIV